MNITNHFTKDDLLIYPSDFEFVSDWAQTQDCLKKSVDTNHPVCPFLTTHFKLPGIHNLVNLNFIILAAEHLKLNPTAIQKSIDTFTGVHHRIEYVANSKLFPNMKVYNDAKSTNWDATITAVKAMEGIGSELFLIIGGKKRGTGDSILPYIDYLKSKVHHFYLIGEMAQEIADEIKGLVIFSKVETLEAVVEDLKMKGFESKPGVLLFSPAFPSFDQFKNYAHRGEHFVSLVSGNS